MILIENDEWENLKDQVKQIEKEAEIFHEEMIRTIDAIGVACKRVRDEIKPYFVDSDWFIENQDEAVSGIQRSTLDRFEWILIQELQKVRDEYKDSVVSKAINKLIGEEED